MGDFEEGGSAARGKRSIDSGGFVGGIDLPEPFPFLAIVLLGTNPVDVDPAVAGPALSLSKIVSSPINPSVSPISFASIVS